MTFQINQITGELDYYKEDFIEINGIYMNVTGINPGKSIIEGGLGYGIWIKIAQSLPLIGAE